MLTSGVSAVPTALSVWSPPPWVGARRDHRSTAQDPWDLAARSSPGFVRRGDFAYASVVVAGARSLDAPAMEAAVATAYGRIAELLADAGAPFPVRFWNYIPGIHGRMSNGQTRYMVFNAGRYRALLEWLGGPSALEQRVATATGVGHGGEDLHVYCLASQTPGRPIENPRQVPAYRYSREHGPIPPCFARATAVCADGRDTLLVGGTASVRGEQSVNRDDIQRQLLETFVNLATLVRAGCSGGAVSEEQAESPWLRRFRRLRAYGVHPEHDGVVRSMIEDRLVCLESLEIVRAQVCRPELLVEVEGVAEIHPGESAM